MIKEVNKSINRKSQKFVSQPPLHKSYSTSPGKHKSVKRIPSNSKGIKSLVFKNNDNMFGENTADFSTALYELQRDDDESLNTAHHNILKMDTGLVSDIAGEPKIEEVNLIDCYMDDIAEDDQSEQKRRETEIFLFDQKELNDSKGNM